MLCLGSTTHGSINCEEENLVVESSNWISHNDLRWGMIPVCTEHYVDQLVPFRSSTGDSINTTLQNCLDYCENAPTACDAVTRLDDLNTQMNTSELDRECFFWDCGSMFDNASMWSWQPANLLPHGHADHMSYAGTYELNVTYGCPDVDTSVTTTLTPRRCDANSCGDCDYETACTDVGCTFNESSQTCTSNPMSTVSLLVTLAGIDNKTLIEGNEAILKNAVAETVCESVDASDAVCTVTSMTAINQNAFGDDGQRHRALTETGTVTPCVSCMERQCNMWNELGLPQETRVLVSDEERAVVWSAEELAELLSYSSWAPFTEWTFQVTAQSTCPTDDVRFGFQQMGSFLRVVISPLSTIDVLRSDSYGIDEVDIARNTPYVLKDPCPVSLTSPHVYTFTDMHLAIGSDLRCGTVRDNSIRSTVIRASFSHKNYSFRATDIRRMPLHERRSTVLHGVHGALRKRFYVSKCEQRSI